MARQKRIISKPVISMVGNVVKSLPCEIIGCPMRFAFYSMLPRAGFGSVSDEAPGVSSRV